LNFVGTATWKRGMSAAKRSTALRASPD